MITTTPDDPNPADISLALARTVAEQVFGPDAAARLANAERDLGRLPAAPHPLCAALGLDVEVHPAETPGAPAGWTVRYAGRTCSGSSAAPVDVLPVLLGLASLGLGLVPRTPKREKLADDAMRALDQSDPAILGRAYKPVLEALCSAA